MSEFQDDTFLARWLNGELSKEELEAFKKSPEYESYHKIRAGADLLDSASFDEAALLSKIKEQQALNLQPKRRSRSMWMYSAAASILIVLGFGLYSLLSSSEITSYQTKIGQQMNVNLPDGSVVVLNANSKLSFDADDWGSERKLSLTGEGYFKVEKGNQFTVITEMGEVSVLGTQFTVQEREDFFEVKCFEGSVKVVSDDQQEILKPKKSVRRIGRKQLIVRDIPSSEPSWLKNRSSFESVPIQYVIKEFQNQYKVQVQGTEIVKNQMFSGSFPHNNMELAMEIVFGSAGVDFERKGNVVVLSN